MTIPELNIHEAAITLKGIVKRTPLQFHPGLSQKYSCEVYLKREDLQPVRSYKIRGAYNKIASLSKEQRSNGIVCASAGNHAQGVAYTCSLLKIKGRIFMPANTPAQKIERVRSFGGDFITIILKGDSFDETAIAAWLDHKETGAILIPPFDDEKIIEGQGTVALEILEDLAEIDFLFLPVGGGGLAAGISYYFNEKDELTVLIGVEPAGAPSMTAAFEAKSPVNLEKIDPFIDGAAVKQVGHLNYKICKKYLHHIHTVAEGKVCAALLKLYNEDGIVCEPAGALSIAALDDFAKEIKGRRVVCILSGGNNDSNRMEEIKKLADAWEGLQHHLVIRFHHNPDGLTGFFQSILGERNYVNRIEYIRRDHGRSTYSLLGIRSQSISDYRDMITRLCEKHIEFKEVQKEDFLFKYWV